MKYFKYLGILLISFFFVNNVKALDIPVADVTYDSTNDWEGTLVIDADQTVKISGINHENTGTTYGAVIRITNNANVNLVFEGENVLEANPIVEGAGIEVEEGSTVNIYGLDGSILIVTGGKNSAGIGGKGYGGVSATNPQAGNINIYSGDITVIGGDKGAGIGAGYHSSASDINILGGDIKAYGTGSGAGIGNGFGTAGGAAVAAGVGFYNGGNITISGDAKVKAAAYHINFDNFDLYNLDTLYGDGYADTFAAGIGGGYGSSSGNIIIEDNADVIAIGSCGGAGIGSGRGTSKTKNYDAENFDVNITIKDNANVIALTTTDRRDNVAGDEGGAAIGLGRGTTIEGAPAGTVKILDNATVYAVASYHTQAIGASNVVDKFYRDENGDVVVPPVGALETLEIASTAKVVAINDGYVDVMDRDKLNGFVNLVFAKSFFEENAVFFTEEKFPLKIEIVDKDDNTNKALFAIQNPNEVQVMFNIGAINNSLIIKDYLLDGQKVYLANEIELDMSNFVAGDEISIYNPTTLTTPLISDAELATEYGNLNIGLEAKEGIFKYDSTFHATLITDNKIKDQLDVKDDVSKSLFVDLGVTDPNNQEYSRLTDNVDLYVQLPDDWDINNLGAFNVLDGKDENINFSISKINGKVYMRLNLEHFSNYAIVQYIVPTPAAANTNINTNTVTNPNTSDNIMTYIILLIISLMSMVGIKVLKENI